MALNYTDQTIDALSYGQADSVDPVLVANPDRKALFVISPSQACLVIQSGLGWEAGSRHGIPLVPNLPVRLNGDNCPTNAMYVVGLSYGAALTILEA